MKWIPSAQGIDPGAPRCDGYHAALARLDLPLISHAGEERAIPGDDALGNPLLLRVAQAGYLEMAAVEPLSAIRRHHPLLFDFVLKRHPRLGGKRLAATVFTTRRFFMAG